MIAMMEHISKKYPGHAWEFVSRSPLRTVFRLMRQGAEEYYVKLYPPARLQEKLLGLLKPKILHEALMLWLLGHSGLPVPGIREHASMKHARFLITHAITPSRGLHAESPARQAEVMLGLSLDLINHGYHCTDMHARNIVLDGSGKPFLVDARGVRPCRRITLENAASLLAQVARQCSLKVSDLEPYLETPEKKDQVARRGPLGKARRAARMDRRHGALKPADPGTFQGLQLFILPRMVF
jgi:hypothetical protein